MTGRASHYRLNPNGGTIMPEERNFMIHSQRWQDENWIYEDDEPGLYYEAADTLQAIIDKNNAVLRQLREPLPPYRPSDRGWWLALGLIVVGALLVITGAAYLCAWIGL